MTGYTSSAASSPPGRPGDGSPAAGAAVLYLAWDTDFIPWLLGDKPSLRGTRLPPPWEPGQHMALIGPTGEGKSTFGVGILGTRSYVLALDPKGEDETLAASGYERVTGLPPAKKLPRDVQKAIDDGRPARLIVGGAARTDDEDARLQALMRDAITYARHAGGWTLYVDEFELLSSQRMFRLGPNIERMLITARRDKTSVVTSFQAAAWVSKHATRQATLCCVWPTRDRNMIKSVAEAMGRDWRTLGQVIDELPPYHVCVIHKQLRAPLLITSAPKVAPRGGARSR